MGDGHVVRLAGHERYRQPIKSHKDLVAWQKAFELCIDVHRQTARFPAEERYGLSFDLRKTSRSVVCNIAEGHQRATTKEFVRLLDISLASIAELETQILLAHRLGLFGVDPGRGLLALTDDVGRLLRALRGQVRRRVLW
jgi:four helix bundle protein